MNCIMMANHRSSASLFSRLCLLVSVGLSVLPLRADDWPQWLGPQRDSVWRERGIVEKFPTDGPPVRWRTAISAGYAGPAVAKGKGALHVVRA